MAGDVDLGTSGRDVRAWRRGEPAPEAEAERIIDARVMRRLASDSAYRNAENAEEQADREAEITRQEEDAFYGGH